jgi:exodeoxyribonuclease VII large subunit
MIPRMDLLDDNDGTPPAPGSNAPELSVSDLAGAVKRVIEGEFGRVRVRGEVGRVSRPSSGHLYFALKDDRASLDAVVWKGQAARLRIRPDEGIEVIAAGRLTTFPGASKYQLIVDQLEPAGAGALMAMLEARRQKLAAEGLFDASRKRPLPYLPAVIGVVTSPSGAVIRDILHRLADRFPSRVILWPVAVQGEGCAPQVAAAIRGFNALPDGGAIPRPDVLIVARGGGSVEDLWGFNDEAVVRAAAASRIPLISAVGHETDTTLIDFAADLRAPTPTAAAELAVPVRADLVAATAALDARLRRAVRAGAEGRAQRLRDLARALPRHEALTLAPTQRLDLAAGRLAAGLRAAVDRKALALGRAAGGLRPALLRALATARGQGLATAAARLGPALARGVERRVDRLSALRLNPAPVTGRLLRDARRPAELLERAATALASRLGRAAERLAALDRQRQTLGWRETLARGFAVILDPSGAPVTRTAALAALPRFTVELADGRTEAAPSDAPTPTRQPAPRKPPARGGPGQGSLF